MKFSLNWLSRYVDLSDVSIDDLANRFTLSVAELEGVETVGQNLETVVVAQIKECIQHPNADRLQVCQVDDGSDTLRTIVCGAPNARPGLVVALALPKTQLGDFKIKVSKVRGVESAEGDRVRGGEAAVALVSGPAPAAPWRHARVWVPLVWLEPPGSADRERSAAP